MAIVQIRDGSCFQHTACGISDGVIGNRPRKRESVQPARDDEGSSRLRKAAPTSEAKMQGHADGRNREQGEMRVSLQQRLTILLSADNQFGNDLQKRNCGSGEAAHLLRRRNVLWVIRRAKKSAPR